MRIETLMTLEVCFHKVARPAHIPAQSPWCFSLFVWCWRRRVGDMNKSVVLLKKALPLLGAFCLYPGVILAASSVEIALDLKSPGSAISPSFVGLSYEMSLVGAATNGGYFFSPANKPLVKMFQTLGIQSLRVGGNTAERATVKVPDKADIDSLFAFARVAGVQVIYTLRLSDSNQVEAAKTAKYIMDNYRAELTCFALGNEPDKLAKDSQDYGQFVRSFMAAINAPTNAPEAVFCGPGATHRSVQWANDFAKDFAHDKRIAMVTQHQYPAGSGRVATNIVLACQKLLSTNLVAAFQKLYDNFVPAVLASGLQYRLEEANSYSNGGAAGSSDAYASALWGLDYMYWWATHGAQGINFHTGGYVEGTRPPSPQKYVVFWNSPEGFTVRPLGYAIKAFDLGGHGQLVPVSFKSNSDQINLTAYGVLSKDGSLRITLINKETAGAREASVTITPGNSYTHGLVVFLIAPKGDITVTDGVTLGGTPIADNGNWSGSWSSLAGSFTNGHLSVRVPAASAAIVALTKE
jgi:hypothetical protein